MIARKTNASRGFTLVEIMIALSLVAMIMTAAALGLQAAQKSYAYNNEKNELVARVRGILDRAVRDVRRSASFVVVDAQTLAVTLPSGMVHTYACNFGGGSVGSVTYTETDTGGIASPPTVLASGVQTFTVTDNSPACTIQIALTGNLSSCSAAVTATPGKSQY